MKTSELTGAALDWAVAKCAEWPMDIWYDEDELPMIRDDEVPEWEPSTSWAQGGPIIEQEKITVVFRIMRDGSTNYWATTEPNDLRADYEPVGLDGPTPLIAAMRCYVASKLGDTVNIPEELQ
jgi:hypothetical protein